MCPGYEPFLQFDYIQVMLTGMQTFKISCMMNGNTVCHLHALTNLMFYPFCNSGNVWVVDFLYTTNKQHVLRDPCKMWACIMFVVTEIATDKQFSQVGNTTSHGLNCPHRWDGVNRLY